jgi:hypothetical protein
MKEDDDEIENSLNFLGESIVGDMKSLIELNGKIASGWLMDSIASKVTKNKNEVYSLSFSYLFYGKFIDKGRKPGKMPPVQDIRDWCRLKGIPQSAAFPIAVSIGKKGYKGINFTDPIRDDLKVIKEIMGDKFSSVYTKELLKNINKPK